MKDEMISIESLKILILILLVSMVLVTVVFMDPAMRGDEPDYSWEEDKREIKSDEYWDRMFQVGVLVGLFTLSGVIFYGMNSDKK
jgi:hypothetical protein